MSLKWPCVSSLLLLLGGSCTDGETEVSEQARRLALRMQEGIALDAELAKRLQVEVLDEVWRVAPELACIGVYPEQDYRRIVVEYPPEAAAQAWTAGRVRTGIARLDSVLEEYDAVSVSEAFATYLVEFAQPLRTDRLAQVMNDGEFGELYAEASPAYGDGDSIELVETDAGWEVVLIARGGDCLSGCIEEHRWTFTVTDRGARLRGSEGDPVPAASCGGDFREGN